MAAPTDLSQTTTSITAAASSHTINVGSPSAGTLLVICFRSTLDIGTGYTMTGYTELLARTATDASDDETWAVWRWADGTEGADDTMTTNGSTKISAICWQVTGARNEAPAISTVNTGTTSANTGNSPSVAPTGAPQDTLYLTYSGGDGEVGAYTAAPTNYVNLATANTGTGGAAASNNFVGGASRQISASSSDDAGVFTHGAHTNGWMSYAIAIRGPAGGMQQGEQSHPLLMTLSRR